MFSATKMLGAVMERGLGGGGMLGTAAKVAGVAAVGGVAYGAYRHYKAGGFGQGGPGLFGGGSAAPLGQPPLSPPSANPFAGAAGGDAGGNPFGGAMPTAQAAGAHPFAGGAPPGGNPWAAASAPQPAGAPSTAASAPGPGAPTAGEEEQALLLVRAMIAAAYVDGRLDETERANIVQAAESAGLGPSERQALEHELSHPWRPNVLFGSVEDVALLRQIYLVTLLAIDRDSPVEQAYVAGLPLFLGLSPTDVATIHQELGFG